MSQMCFKVLNILTIFEYFSACLLDGGMHPSACSADEVTTEMSFPHSEQNCSSQ